MTDVVPARPGFAREGERADVAVLAVTYRNAAHVEALITSLRGQRGQGGQQRLRVVVVDNASDDGTLDAVRRHDDVLGLDAGANLGYAGAINVAMAHTGDVPAVLVLNPDLVLRAGSVAALRSRIARSGAGAVVPRIVDADGGTYRSLHREPSLLRALGDAAFGAHLPGRSGALSETVLDPATYRRARTVDWATGAAVLLDRAVAERVGPWDERFFLYSEEADYLRRVRDAGSTVWYEPAAVVRHDQGGSGRSAGLQALLAVNRVRYARKHLGPARATAYRAVVTLHEAARAYRPAHRAVLGTLLRERSWTSLPQAAAR